MMKRNKESGILFRIGTVIFVCLLLAVLSAVSGCDSTGLQTADRTERIAVAKSEAAQLRVLKIRQQRRDWARQILAESN